jgi:hypothetical protein
VPRSEARIFTSIWDDEDFLALPPGPQRLYLFLTSQKDLAYCGVIALRPGRWARKAKGMTAAQIEADLELLAAGPRPFIIADEDTGELLVRSLVRHDGVWKVPNIMKSARESAALIESPAIRAALLAELLRIPAQESEHTHVRKAHAQFVDELRATCGNPSPNPPDNPSDNPSPNPAADPSQGKGEGYGPVLQVSPNPGPPSPQPRASAGEAMRPLWPAAEPDAKPGEEEEPQQDDQGRDLAPLVAEIRAIRDDWSTESIVRTLNDPSILERPWPLVRAAALIVARDPSSALFGRLKHDGPWWQEARAQLARQARPAAEIETHPYNPSPDIVDRCQCGRPASNRCHAEAKAS